MRIVSVHLGDADETELSPCWDGVSEQYCKRIKRFVRKEDRVRSLVGHALARWMLGEQTGVEPQTIHFAEGAHGKPYWPDRPDVHFNVSHSGDWVVAVVDDADVGIDIERIRRPDLKVAERFFAPQEYATLLRLQDERARTEFFFELWTLKESYVKALGFGLSYSFGRFCVLPAKGMIRIDDPSAPIAYYARSCPAPEGYKLAVCGRNSAITDNPEYFEIREFLVLWKRATGRLR